MATQREMNEFTTFTFEEMVDLIVELREKVDDLKDYIGEIKED